jgi:hypothetical protein
MCEIVKPLKIIDVEPLSLPATLRRQQEQHSEEPVTVEVPVAETDANVNPPIVGRCFLGLAGDR